MFTDLKNRLTGAEGEDYTDARSMWLRHGAALTEASNRSFKAMIVKTGMVLATLGLVGSLNSPVEGLVLNPTLTPPTVLTSPIAVSPPIPLTLADKTCLKQVVYHEARGEPLLGKVLVATVVLNRYQSNRYPDSVCGVVYQPKQFSRIEQTAFPRTFPTSVVQAVDIAVGLVDIELTLPVNLQALSHFHSGRPPFWATEDTFVAKVGGHSFHALH